MSEMKSQETRNYEMNSETLRKRKANLVRTTHRRNHGNKLSRAEGCRYPDPRGLKGPNKK